MHVACPSCSKNFKVTAAALGQAKGFVRCGSCRHIFNALPLLIDDPVPFPSLVPAMTPVMVGGPKIAIPVSNVIAPSKEEPKPQPEPDKKKKFRFLNKEITVLLAAAALSPAIVKLIEMIPPPKPGAPVETVVETPVPVLLQPEPTKPNSPTGKLRTTTTNSDPVINLIRETIPKELRVESSTSEDKPIQFGDATVEQNGDQPVITFDNRSPEELLAEARTLLLNRNGSYDKAIEDLKAIILTQPHDKAREAHEVLGYAYEKSKLIDKAMLEYQRYLALYPEDNEDRTRVRQRLMTLEILDPDGGRPRMAGVITSKEPRKGDSFDFHGNFSDYFYSSFSEGTKQYEMLSAGNFIMKLQHNQYDLTSKVRFSKVNDFSNSSENKTVVTNAYVDLQDTFKGYGIRVGRQPSQAGAISRFDGVSANAPIGGDVKLTLAAGTPYIGPNQTTVRKFQGAEVDWNVNRDWVLGTYVNRETADNFLERMAVGTNVQYFDKNTNLLVRTEYDTVYHSLNLVTVQAMKYVGVYDFFLVYDRRKSPMPYGDVALGLGLLGPSKEVYSSVGDIFNKSGLAPTDIYTYISNTTPVASALVLGANKKLNKDWTATVNVQSTNISTTPGFNVAPQFNPVPLQVGQENTYSFNAHLKGDNVYATNNTVEFVANKGIGATKSFYATAADEYRFGEKKQNSLSLILRYDNYLQNLIYTHNTTGILRGFYEVGENKMFEAQVSRTMSVTDPMKGPAQSANNTTFYVGFRYDF